MSYRLEDGEAVPEGIKRIALEQIDKALSQTKASQRDIDTAVHDARVCFKKTRALLRLVRRDIDDVFQRENALYRDLGRELAAVRNDMAMVETFKNLKERFTKQLASHALDDLRHPFLEARKARSGDKRKVLSRLAKELPSARRRVEKWPLRKDGFPALIDGLRQVYKQGSKSFATARKEPTVENLHEWRKQVKYLMYDMRIVRRSWPKMSRKLADELERLGDYLSDDHDLAILRQSATGQGTKANREQDLEILIALIDERRAEIQLQAKLLGRRIYAEKPDAFVRRLETYWQAWQSELRSEPMAVNAPKTPAA